MTTTKAGLAAALDAAMTRALDQLLLSMADDELVIGFSDSEWTGIAPILEEDVAMSSLAQDELGHARALYELLAGLRDDGGDADSIAYDREPHAYRHCRLLDHPRGDWADTIVRRFLYDTADTVRLEALDGGAWAPLADLVAKIRREERYHVMHATTWFDRLASAEGEARRRLEEAIGRMGADAGTVFTPLAGERLLVAGGILAAPMAELEARWRTEVAVVFGGFGLPPLPATREPDRGRMDHSDAFRWLHGEFSAVRRSDPEAAW